MSSLGVSLLILIVATGAGLALYNWWANRRGKASERNERHVEPHLPDSPQDRKEPSFNTAGKLFDQMPASVDNQRSPEVPSSLPTTAETASSSAVQAFDQPGMSWGDVGKSLDEMPAEEPLAGTTSEHGAGVQSVISKPQDKPELNSEIAALDAGDLAGLAPGHETAGDIGSEPIAAHTSEFAQSETQSIAEPDTAGADVDQAIAAKGTEQNTEQDHPISTNDLGISRDPDTFEGQSPTENKTSSTLESKPQALGEVGVSASGTKANEPVWSGIDVDHLSDKFLASVNLELPAPVAGQALLALTADLTHAGTKPIRVSAVAAEPNGQVVGQALKPSGQYGLLRFELLQVNRQGPVTGVEYSEFVSKLNAIGDSLGVLVNAPDMNVVLMRSRALDGEVAALDAQVAVNIEADQAILTEQFIDCATRMGLETTADGKYLNRDKSGWVLNTVQLDVAANRVVMLLDVPTVPRELQPIRQMVECAWTIAQAVDGRMIDDSGRSIDNALFERIESQLEIHYQALLAAGIPAGSDLAQQVYNAA